MPVKVKSPDLAALLRDLQAASKDAPKSFKLAMLSARRIAKKDSADQSAKVYNIAADRIGKDLTSKGITGYDFSIVGRKRRRGPSLVAYGASRGAAGLTVTVIKSRGPKVIRSSFIANDLSGKNKLAFVRDGAKRIMRAGRYAGKFRQPLRALYGPSVADMLINNAVYNPIHDRFISNVSSDITKRIIRALKRG